MLRSAMTSAAGIAAVALALSCAQATEKIGPAPLPQCIAESSEKTQLPEGYIYLHRPDCKLIRVKVEVIAVYGPAEIGDERAKTAIRLAEAGEIHVFESEDEVTRAINDSKKRSACQ
jgi:hypothetical protein